MIHIPVTGIYRDHMHKTTVTNVVGDGDGDDDDDSCMRERLDALLSDSRKASARRPARLATDLTRIGLTGESKGCRHLIGSSLKRRNLRSVPCNVISLLS